MKTITPGGKYNLWEDITNQAKPKKVALPLTSADLSNPNTVVTVFRTREDQHIVTVLEDSFYEIERRYLSGLMNAG